MIELQSYVEHYTVDDYLGWPQAVHHELIHGGIFAMSPAPVIEYLLPSGKPYLPQANLMNERRAVCAPVCSVLYAPVGGVLAGDSLRQPIAPDLSTTPNEPSAWLLPRAVRQNLLH